MDKPEIAGNSIRIPPKPKYLTDVDEFVERFLKRNGVDESAIADIAISVSELVNNALSHGSRWSPDKWILIVIEREDGTVTISVTDSGSGFDPDDIDDPLADENLLKETGRGIFIVRALMDSIDIQATSAGTTVTITKAV